MRRIGWALIVLGPALLFAVLFLGPVERWNPGRPGLASGVLEVEFGPCREETPWLARGRTRSAASCRYRWREGNAVRIVLRDAQGNEMTLDLSPRLFGGPRVGCVLIRTGRPPVPERLPLRGRVVLADRDWSRAHPPMGTVEVVVSGGDRPERWSAAFVPKRR